VIDHLRDIERNCFEPLRGCAAFAGGFWTGGFGENAGSSLSTRARRSEIQPPPRSEVFALAGGAAMRGFCRSGGEALEPAAAQPPSAQVQVRHAGAYRLRTAASIDRKPVARLHMRVPISSDFVQLFERFDCRRRHAAWKPPLAVSCGNSTAPRTGLRGSIRALAESHATATQLRAADWNRSVVCPKNLRVPIGLLAGGAHRGRHAGTFLSILLRMPGETAGRSFHRWTARFRKQSADIASARRGFSTSLDPFREDCIISSNSSRRSLMLLTSDSRESRRAPSNWSSSPCLAGKIASGIRQAFPVLRNCFSEAARFIKRSPRGLIELIDLTGEVREDERKSSMRSLNACSAAANPCRLCQSPVARLTGCR